MRQLFSLNCSYRITKSHFKPLRKREPGYPSEPGLEGELSEEMEVTEATDSGL